MELCESTTATRVCFSVNFVLFQKPPRACLPTLAYIPFVSRCSFIGLFNDGPPGDDGYGAVEPGLQLLNNEGNR